MVTSLYDIERAEIPGSPELPVRPQRYRRCLQCLHPQTRNWRQQRLHRPRCGSARHFVTEGAINTSHTDNLATRVSGYYSQENGFARNVFSGRDEIEHEKWAVRVSTRYETERLSVDAIIEYEERQQSGSMYRAIDRGDIWDTFDEYVTSDTTLQGNDEELDSDISYGDEDDADILTLGLLINYDLGFATLTSNTGYKDHDYFYKEDYDGTPLNINNFQFDQSGEYFQQELRLTSNSDGPLGWYAGASYYHEDLEAEFRNIGSRT